MTQQELSHIHILRDSLYEALSAYKVAERRIKSLEREITDMKNNCDHHYPNGDSSIQIEGHPYSTCVICQRQFYKNII